MRGQVETPTETKIINIFCRNTIFLLYKSSDFKTHKYRCSFVLGYQTPPKVATHALIWLVVTFQSKFVNSIGADRKHKTLIWFSKKFKNIKGESVTEMILIVYNFQNATKQFVLFDVYSVRFVFLDFCWNYSRQSVSILEISTYSCGMIWLHCKQVDQNEEEVCKYLVLQQH